MKHNLGGTTQSWAAWPWVLCLGCAGGAVACSASKASYGEDGGNGAASGGSLSNDDDGAAAPGLGQPDDDAPIVEPPPEEKEDPGNFRAPVVSGSFLWSANPESGRVALIDSRDSNVRLLSAGLRPTHVFAVPSKPDEPKALVQNVGSADASLLGLIDGEVEERRIATPSEINRWTVAPSGEVAIAWSAPEESQALDPTEGLQEILVASLADAEEEPVRLTVGYRPRSIVISDDEQSAVVISEDGLSVIGLESPYAVTRWIPLGVQGGLDTSVTRDADYALVRRAGSHQIEVLSIEDPAQPTLIEMTSPVTDLDLGPNGLVVAVAREAGEVLTFSMAKFDAEHPDVSRTQISGVTVGSAAITEGGERAVLYTTVTPEERVAVLELTPGEHFLDSRLVSTKLAVKAVETSPNGRYAVVLGDSPSDGKGGFSLVPLDQDRFPRIVGTSAPVQAVALTDSGVMVTAASATVFEAYVGRLPELTVQTHALASRPLATGVVSDLTIGFVAQSHPEGRVTFFDLRGTDVRTVSGYELSAEVIDE